jgi:hemerythrin
MSRSFFIWKEEYSMHIQEIDDQHKVIVELLNDLYDAFLRKEHENKTGEILSRLTDYAFMHFKLEEKYFLMFNYHEKVEHKLEHKKFVERVETFKEEFNKNKTALTYKIINFLRDWLSNHIMVSDKKYVPCFRENGLK